MIQYIHCGNLLLPCRTNLCSVNQIILITHQRKERNPPSFPFTVWDLPLFPPLLELIEKPSTRLGCRWWITWLIQWHSSSIGKRFQNDNLRLLWLGRVGQCCLRCIGRIVITKYSVKERFTSRLVGAFLRRFTACWNTIRVSGHRFEEHRYRSQQTAKTEF